MATYLEAITADHVNLAAATGDPSPLRNWILSLAFAAGCWDPTTGQVTSWGLQLVLAAAISAAHPGAHPRPFATPLPAILDLLPHERLAPIAHTLSRAYFRPRPAHLHRPDLHA